ncbi:MAG: hypothetical protein ACPGJV_09135 [Bacteriovoracaceae bacterium]
MQALVVFLFLLSFNVQAKEDLRVMFYNVENLFDTVHDEGKNDFTYTPKGTKGKTEACEKISYHRYKKECHKTSWTEDKLKLKLNQIKRVVDEVRPKPQILGLCEIENENVVSMLAKKLGYKSFIVSDSPDKRGIDLAILYNENKELKYVSKKEHSLKGKMFEEKPSRNILEGNFKYEGKNLSIFVNHWPSLSNPTETRLIAAKTLKARIDQILKADKNHAILAIGDFNTIPTNYPHPFESVLLSDKSMRDLDTTYRKDRSIGWDVKNKQPLGTYFYARAMTWNLLDRIFFSSNLLDQKGFEIDVASYRIFSPEFITRTFIYERKGEYLYGSKVNGVPARYNHQAKNSKTAGFSDHFALYVDLK